MEKKKQQLQNSHHMSQPEKNCISSNDPLVNTFRIRKKLKR